MVTEQDLKVFFEKLDSIKYLVMRNYVDILNDINSGGDIDLLVESAESFVKCTMARPLNNRSRCYNYEVEIGDNWVPVDIRIVGDGYYDGMWEKAMLSNRVAYKDDFFVMNEEDYFYSIAYHSLMHKPSIPAKYVPLFETRQLYSKKDISRSLIKFMKIKGYNVVVPDDMGVKYNSGNARSLKLHIFFSL